MVQMVRNRCTTRQPWPADVPWGASSLWYTMVQKVHPGPH